MLYGAWPLMGARAVGYDRGMPFTMVKEDSAYKCSQCGHILSVKKGQLLPPCPKCGGAMEKHEGPAPESPACA